jgi:hypothetical protein
MSQNKICAKCGRELRGAQEICLVVIGPFVMVLVVDTPDCNWINCKTCGTAVCKSCYKRNGPPGDIRGPDRVIEIATPPQ